MRPKSTPPKLTFLLSDGTRIVVRGIRPAPDWAEGERLLGRIGRLFFRTQVLLYFEGEVAMGKLVAIWKIHPRVQIFPRPIEYLPLYERHRDGPPVDVSRKRSVGY